MTNETIARTFERVADLLEQQGASTFRARAWRDGALGLREHDRQAADVFRDHGRVGLEAIPHIGPRLASVIIEMLRTGRCATLDRIEGDPVHALASVPGLGPRLADRIHRELGIGTLEELEAAVHDGRLAAVPGFGPRRLAALGDVLSTRLARRADRAPAEARRRPPAALLLDIDRAYREAAAAGALHRIAPRRFNPGRQAWLPIMHGERDGWSFTALFSNTELAHRLGRTDDWVIVYFHEPHGPEGQATIVTEHAGPLQGLRVVRGREREVRDLAGADEAAALPAGDPGHGVGSWPETCERRAS
jgi:hypothetical protein